MVPSRTDDWYLCPGCGAEVKVGSEGCEHCAGLDEDSLDFENYTEEADPGFADIPAGHSGEDDEFDYEEFVGREFEGKPRYTLNPAWVAIALALFLVVMFLILATGGF